MEKTLDYKIIEKAAILIEAFPYIREFRDKMIVVKYGGSTQPEEGGFPHDNGRSGVYGDRGYASRGRTRRR